MLLSPDDAELFFRLHRSLMHFVNQRLGVVPDVVTPEEFATLPPQDRLEVRKAFLNNLDLIEAFVNENPAKLGDDELDIVLSWRHQVSGTFYAFRQLKKYMVFLSSSDPPVAYGVVALTEPFEDLLGPHLPRMTETVLLPFKGRIVYDGLLGGYNISFGGGIKRMLNDSYRQAKERLGVVTSLPVESTRMPVTARAEPRKRKAKKKTPGVRDVKQVLQTIVEMTDAFCHQHLNDEYAQLCRKLAEKLSRKRPSPLLRGKPKTWACGIIRTIGMVNDLDDPTTQPHMKLTSIDRALGVGESTGQAKSMEIRKMLKMRSRVDSNWMLPSRTDDNARNWMSEVNDFVMDVCQETREVQKVAFENGLAPSIPADREAGSAKFDDEHREEPSAAQLFQFRITLKGSKAAIWRRIQVQDCTLDDLHQYIQMAMGWTNSHLYQFEIDGRRYGDPALLDDGFMDIEYADSTVTRITDIVPADGRRFRFLYEYDFGDRWEHRVLFEGCPPAESGQQYPLCVEGERACPPEDVGGVWGYAEFLQALADPSHERHEELLDWSGPFDPDAFDAAEATRAMQAGRPAWR